jgi:ammonia channel protein AmtB
MARTTKIKRKKGLTQLTILVFILMVVIVVLFFYYGYNLIRNLLEHGLR